MGMPADNLLCLANEAFWFSRGLISALYRKGNPNLVIIGKMGKDADVTLQRLGGQTGGKKHNIDEQWLLLSLCMSYMFSGFSKLSASNMDFKIYYN